MATPDLLRRLAEREPSDLPVLSIYLDMRPQATGQSPGRRASLTVLKDRFSEIERALGPRGDDLDSFRADQERIREFLDESFDRAADGLAIFACSGAGLWETVEAGIPFEDEIVAGPVPQLFQLARLLDEHQTAVVAVVDTNTARLFVSRVGRLDERGGPDEDSVHHQKRQTGGWSQARYQRHIDKHHEDFAREAADAITRLVERYEAGRVVLAGDEVALKPLQDALPDQVTDKVGEILRLDIRTSPDDLAAAIRPVLERMEAEASESAADLVLEAVRAGGLGVAGLEPTRKALEIGQVDRLLLAGNGALDDDERNELIRMATTSAADVEIVEGHEGLERAGGVGALLRYRID
jgi:peptide chain release factor subunit 1